MAFNKLSRLLVWILILMLSSLIIEFDNDRLYLEKPPKTADEEIEASYSK